MVELTQGIFQTSKSIFKNNRGSLLRTLIYTIGHFAIAIICLMLINLQLIKIMNLQMN